MPFLSLLGGGKAMLYAIAALVIVTVIGGFYLWLHGIVAENGRLTAANAVQATQLDQAAEVNAQNVKALAALEAEAQRQAAIAATERQARAATDARAATLMKGITNAKPGEDAAIAPVLRHVLDGLRNGAAGAPAGRGAGGAGAGGSGAPGLPASP